MHSCKIQLFRVTESEDPMSTQALIFAPYFTVQNSILRQGIKQFSPRTSDIDGNLTDNQGMQYTP